MSCFILVFGRYVPDGPVWASPGESLKRECRKTQKWEFSFFPAQYQLSCSGKEMEKP